MEVEVEVDEDDAEEEAEDEEEGGGGRVMWESWFMDQGFGLKGGAHQQPSLRPSPQPPAPSPPSPPSVGGVEFRR